VANCVLSASSVVIFNAACKPNLISFGTSTLLMLLIVLLFRHDKSKDRIHRRIMAGRSRTDRFIQTALTLSLELQSPRRSKLLSNEAMI
jgi:hypothetical protein